MDLYSNIYKESVYPCNCKSKNVFIVNVFIFQESGCTFFKKKKKKKKKERDPWFTMGKNIKSYATTQQSISPRKGREASWQKVQIFRLKYGTA